MSITRLFSTTAFAIACITAISSLSQAEDAEVIFTDDFDRDDAEEVGNKWATTGTAVLKDKAILFKVREREFRPRLKHAFPVQEKGKFSASFVMDWIRESEGTWGFYMQLGNSAEIPGKLVYLDDLSKGIGVNLVWGGGELVGFEDAGSFGYLKDGKFNPLFVANDSEVKGSVVERPIVTIEVDLDSKMFSVGFNGKNYTDLPFDNEGPIDTIRFITNGCSESGFSRTSIDEVSISRSK